MEIMKKLHTKHSRTFLMSNRVRHAEIVVGEGKMTNKIVCGLFAISKNDSHRLFADAQGAELETLILAAEIVYAHMYFITDEALRVAVLIARGSDETDDAILLETAKQYLAQGMTVSKVRLLVAKAREKMKRQASSQMATETARAQNLMQIGRHLRQMSNQPQPVAA